MFSETLSGLVTIRAYDKTSAFIRQNERLIDANLQAYDATIAMNRWYVFQSAHTTFFMI
jgi:hypothetical protein